MEPYLSPEPILHRRRGHTDDRCRQVTAIVGPPRAAQRRPFFSFFLRGRTCRWIGEPTKPNSSRSRRSMNRT